MHILAIVVAVLGGIGIFLWRMQQAANATRDIADAAGDVGGAPPVEMVAQVQGQSNGSRR